MREEALFERQGEHYIPTALAGSPWHPALLHGGAPAGLMAHCLEQAVGATSLQPARLTIDLMRPVPQAPLTVKRRNLRTGKRIMLEEVSLLADDKVVAIATGLFVQPHSVTLPEYAPQQFCSLPAPESLPEINFREILFTGSQDLPPGLHTTVRLRPASKLCEQGQGKGWLSLPVAIVAGEPNTPFMRVALVSDFSNGVGQLSLGNSVGVINADITLQLLRLPESDWIGMESRTLLQPDGIGMVQAQLFDTRGLIGQVMQTAMPMLENART